MKTFWKTQKNANKTITDTQALKPIKIPGKEIEIKSNESKFSSTEEEISSYGTFTIKKIHSYDPSEEYYENLKTNYQTHNQDQLWLKD